MAEKKREISESSIARIAGNIMSGFAGGVILPEDHERYVALSVKLARAIAAEVTRTAPREEP